MEQRRKHPFNEGTVITGLCPNGEYGAYREDEDEGRVRGYGHSRLAAIADLVEALETAEHGATYTSIMDGTYNREAQAAFEADHARDHAKNSEAV